MPNDIQKTLSLEHRAKGFVLIKTDKNDEAQEINLDEADILFLPRILQETIAKISVTKSQSSGSIYAKPAIQVCGAQLNVTTDGKSILLSFVDAFSNEATFVLPHDIALPLGERLFARASELKASVLPK
jgi:hypothetical protein